MTHSLPLAAGFAPRNGDVLVTRESKSGVRHTVREIPGIVQFTTAGRDEALRLARLFARRQEVDVWYSEDGTYRLLEAYRSRTTHPAGGHDQGDVA